MPKVKLMSLLKKFGIGSGITIMGILAGIWWAAAQGCEKYVDPHIAEVASKIDTVSHIPIYNAVQSIAIDAAQRDTTLRVIRSLLEVMATNDQKIAACNLRNSGLYK